MSDQKDEKNVTDNEIIKSGNLTKQGGKHKTWKKRWFVLKSNHTLVYYKNQNTNHPLGAISLDGGYVFKASYKNSFQIVQEESRDFFIQASSPQLREEWMDAITKSILLLTPERKYQDRKPHLTGNLKKEGQRFRRWKDFHFHLYDNIITYYQNEQKIEFPLGVIFLNNLQAKIEFNNNQDTPVIRLNHPTRNSIVLLPILPKEESQKGQQTKLEKFEKEKEMFNQLLNSWFQNIDFYAQKCTKEHKNRLNRKLMASFYADSSPSPVQGRRNLNIHEIEKGQDESPLRSPLEQSNDIDLENNQQNQDIVSANDSQIEQVQPTQKKQTRHLQSFTNIFFDGYLWISSNKMKRKRYWFLLNGIYLFYSRAAKSITEPKGFILISKSIIIADLDLAAQPFTIILKQSTDSEYLIECDTKEEQISWVNNMKSAIQSFYYFLRLSSNLNKQGFLSCLPSDSKKQWKKKFFIIRSDHLDYYKMNPENPDAIPDLSQKAQHSISLKGAQLKPANSITKKPLSFEIGSTEGKHMLFFAESHTDYLEWIKTLHGSITVADGMEMQFEKLDKQDIKILKRLCSFREIELNLMFQRFCDDYPKKYMTYENLVDFFGKIGITNRKQIQILFLGFNKSKNGQLNFRELFIGLYCLFHGSFVDKMAFGFSIFDSEGDGKVTPQSIWKIFAEYFNMENKDLLVQIEKMFEHFDSSKKGYLTLEEFLDLSSETKYLIKSFNIFSIEN